MSEGSAKGSDVSRSFQLGPADVVGAVVGRQCPACGLPILYLATTDHRKQPGGGPAQVVHSLLWPRSARRPVPSGVPAAFAKDYLEASAVLPYSANASAALSRRCLQGVLREAGKTKSRELGGQIEEVRATIPDYLYQQLDNVRRVGNYAAHPNKSAGAGGVVDVEPGEAEMNLNALDDLFDYYYVKLPKVSAVRASLDARQAAAAAGSSRRGRRKPRAVSSEPETGPNDLPRVASAAGQNAEPDVAAARDAARPGEQERSAEPKPKRSRKRSRRRGAAQPQA